jgi:hypothetical protein
MSYEGSTEVDGGNVPYQEVEESNDEIEVRDDDQGEGESQTEVTETEGEGEGEGGQKPQLTEKGTKLDPNPLSAAHQQLANERKLRAQYEQVLSDPALLKRYAKEAGMTLEEAKAEIKDEKAKLYTPDRFKSAQDLADVLNELQGNFTQVNQTVAQLKEENQRLRGELTGISGSRQLERVANNMGNDINAIQSAYPQLNPKSPEYDPELEKEIGSFYHELDFDPSTGGYRGQYSLAKITERFMRVRGEGAKRGSQQAQTIVKTRQAGRVVTSSKGGSKDTPTASNPGTSIAQKIAKTLGNG